MMTGDTRDSTVARLMGSTFHNDQIQARSDIPQPFGLMNLLAGAQKVSEAIDKYNNLNQE